MEEGIVGTATWEACKRCREAKLKGGCEVQGVLGFELDSTGEYFVCDEFEEDDSSDEEEETEGAEPPEDPNQLGLFVEP